MSGKVHSTGDAITAVRVAVSSFARRLCDVVACLALVCAAFMGAEQNVRRRFRRILQHLFYAQA